MNRQRRRPGPGFYALARELDYEFDDEDEFWRAQLGKVHQIWGGSSSSSAGGGT
jgi:hypothetical protein